MLYITCWKSISYKLSCDKYLLRLQVCNVCLDTMLLRQILESQLRQTVVFIPMKSRTYWMQKVQRANQSNGSPAVHLSRFCVVKNAMKGCLYVIFSLRFPPFSLRLEVG